MFDRFRSNFAPTRDELPHSEPWTDRRLERVRGYGDFVGEFAGASFAGGKYRVHDRDSGPKSVALITEAFPRLADRIVPFSYDWLGRQFGLDFGRIEDGEPGVLLLEPGTGGALEIPASFVKFHDEELVEFDDAALATNFFDEWVAITETPLPIGRDQCVGYRVPLFLGGRDVVDNLDLVDLEVYWAISGELLRGTRRLPHGASIRDVSGA